MRLALKLAQKGRGYTSPNPVVGSCVVKNGRLVSSGHHRSFGGSHAEVEAIRKAGRNALGSDLYVTLEPCSTFGKTPPCVPLIAEAGIKRVIIGTTDPNPKHKGRGISELRKKGIRVMTRVLSKEAEKQIEAFRKWVQTGIPFVTLKMAQSLDGKIAAASGESRWVSGARARAWVHELRASHDAVLVGKNTVLWDDPRLTARNGRFRKDPWRIVLDERGAISPKARIFGEGGPTVLACSARWFSRAAKKFRATRVHLIPLRSRSG
jgi:diaminohydroxyphosphoribosylaminopyrimidine deaminase/5-amino-6-(5-phosphoribosylamino)uracil reductase